MSEYLVSTIIPNYNNAPYIEDCVLSILNQSYKNKEIIIVDDCSSDGSQKIIRGLEQKYENIKAIYNIKNMGITMNRKIGIAKARGQYINYLDSDDFIENTQKLEREMEIIKYFKEKYGEDVIAFSDVKIADASGKIVSHFRDIKPVKEGYILWDLITRRCLIPQNFTFSKELYERVGGHDESISFYENWDLKIRLSKLNKYVFTGGPGFVYRRHGNGLSNVDITLHKHWVQKIANKNIVLIESKDRKIVIDWIKEMVNDLGFELDFINAHLKEKESPR